MSTIFNEFLYRIISASLITIDVQSSATVFHLPSSRVLLDTPVLATKFCDHHRNRLSFCFFREMSEHCDNPDTALLSGTSPPEFLH